MNVAAVYGAESIFKEFKFSALANPRVHRFIGARESNPLIVERRRREHKQHAFKISAR